MKPHPLYDDDVMVSVLMDEIMASGHRLLQIFLLADEDGEHCAKLLELIDPPREAIILDAGCGIGTVSNHLHLLRPDLKFILLNISRAQLNHCMTHGVFRPLQGDIENMPLEPKSVDVVMFNYSVGHGDIETLFREAWRVLRPGGVLFCYDLAAEDTTVLELELHYHAPSAEDYVATAVVTGFKECDILPLPHASPKRMIPAMISEEEFARVFAGVQPIAFRAVKPA